MNCVRNRYLTMWLTLAILQQFMPRDGGAEASQHEKELYNKLLQSYSKHVRPVKRYTEPVRVRVAFSLVEVLSIDEDNGQLSVKAWLTMNWRDEYLMWTPASHGGITRLNFNTGPDAQIWTPDIVVFSALKTEIDYYAQAVVSYGGSVTWIQPAVYVVRCRHRFRGNSWVAEFQLGSWTYDESLLDLQPLPLSLRSSRTSSASDDGDQADDVDVHVGNFSENDHWAMLEHAGKRKVHEAVCCEVSHFARYQSLYYELKLRKKLGPSLLGRRRRK